MAVEVPTADQQAVEAAALAACQASLQQNIDQDIAEQLKKAKEEIDKAKQKLAAIPPEMLAKLEQLKDKLLKIINGYENPKSLDFDPEKFLKEIEAMLQPILDGLTKLPAPSIPGLSDVQSLISALLGMLKNDTGLSDAELNIAVPKRPSLPTDLLDTIQELIAAISMLCATLPIVMINVIFNMLSTIIDLFKQIQAVVGVPQIPYPLTLVPDCLELCPKILDLMLNMPTKISCSVKGIARKKLQELTAMQIPKPPDDITAPQVLPACPKR